MTFWQGSTAELVTAAAAVIAIPFYLGIIHAAVPQLVLYSGVAGAAIASGEYAESPQLKRGGLRLFLAEAGVWFAVTALLGGLAYCAALIF